MKFVNWSSLHYRRIRVLLYSTKTLASPPPPPPPPPPTSNTLLKCVVSINDPKASVVPFLEKWINEGKTVNKEELQSVISTTRRLNRHLHALEISQWMTDRRYFDLSSGDIAVRLKLIYLVQGIERAEKYFNSISKHLRVSQTYGALLDCYVKQKSVGKAEAILHEMKTMGFVSSSLPYNCLIHLYAQTGQQDKIEILVAEMEEKGIPQDIYTLSNRLEGYVALSDTTGMKNMLDLMENENICVDWSAYSLAAKGYLKLGLIDECLKMLKKLEAMTIRNRTVKASDFLLTLYASAGKKDDVTRIWKSYVKRLGKSRYSSSHSYRAMISALDKLDDLEGAEKIFDEWVSKYNTYDCQVVNQLISVYCKRRLFSRAEALAQEALKKAEASGRSFYASTWNILAMAYLSDKEMKSKGVEMLKKAFLVGRQGWKPSPVTVASCLEYFEQEIDVKGAEEFVEILGASGLLSREVYHWFLRIHIAADKPLSHVLDLMKADGLSADEETCKILQDRPDLC